MRSPKLTAIDLFAGAGGASQGLKDAGFTVLAAVENDRFAAETYRRNHPRTLLVESDIVTVSPSKLRIKLGLRREALTLLKACPPCQGYSSIGKMDISDPRNDLVAEMVRFAVEFLPKIVLLENVPGLRRDQRFKDVLQALTELGYVVREYILDARDFGVPQRRRRLIVVAVRDRRRSVLPADLVSLLDKRFFRGKPTLHKIFSYDKTRAARRDPLQKKLPTRADVDARIRAIPVGGNRKHLPADLVLPCHARLRSAAVASYGRIDLGAVAPTMTTRCTTPACGSFIHPTEPRPITLREAALIQTFPRKYVFAGGRTQIERQIGNALPVRMARGLGLIALKMLRNRR